MNTAGLTDKQRQAVEQVERTRSVREVADHVWLISFMRYDLGFFDDETCRVECAPKPLQC
jgi:hypothetical protein